MVLRGTAANFTKEADVVVLSATGQHSNKEADGVVLRGTGQQTLTRRLMEWF